TLNLKQEQTAYIGDDLLHLPVLEKVGLTVAVADAHPLLTPRADYFTHILGGRGAVRELCDFILLAQGRLEEAKCLSI
ncbi:HAD hydrolase family protein, partial [Proteus mirabilis]|uniref:HAD hydrolase family protein n=1 Tax=Proteus mirabilis TaxID=584 RepID=UPI00257710A7